MLGAFADVLISVEAAASGGAVHCGERTDQRVNSPNGSLGRDWDTRVGTVDLAAPKLREGTYYPDWLLTHSRRAARVLPTVMAQCYVEGGSTRQVDDLAEAMGIDRLSKSQASRRRPRSMSRSRSSAIAGWMRAHTCICGSTPSRGRWRPPMHRPPCSRRSLADRQPVFTRETGSS